MQGSSATFSNEQIRGIPLGLECGVPTYRTQLHQFLSTVLNNTSDSFETVFREMYQLYVHKCDREVKLALLATANEEKAYVVGRRENVIPQYKLKTVTQSTRLVHIITSESFGHTKEGTEDVDFPSAGSKWYTNGMIWTNTNPQWEWSGRGQICSGERMFRCRIDVPADTQVVLDLSPVKRRECELVNGRTSVFPDVLLPPAEFAVQKVTRYMQEVDDEENMDGVVYVSPPKKMDESEDFAYARRVLSSTREFVDVELSLTKSMILPVPEAICDDEQDCNTDEDEEDCEGNAYIPTSPTYNPTSPNYM